MDPDPDEEQDGLKFNAACGNKIVATSVSLVTPPPKPSLETRFTGQTVFEDDQDVHRASSGNDPQPHWTTLDHFCDTAKAWDWWRMQLTVLSGAVEKDQQFCGKYARRARCDLNQQAETPLRMENHQFDVPGTIASLVCAFFLVAGFRASPLHLDFQMFKRPIQHIKAETNAPWQQLGFRV